MAHDYIYFAGSLPLLVFGAKPPLSIAEFDADAARLTDAADAAILQRVELMPDDGAAMPPAVLKYHDWENTLRNTWLDFRKKEHPDAADFKRGYPDCYAEIAPGLAQAAAAANPLEAEKIIDRMRWARLDELNVGHIFDFEMLCLYRIRLRILEKYAAHSTAGGNAVLERVLGALEIAETNS